MPKSTVSQKPGALLEEAICSTDEISRPVLLDETLMLPTAPGEQHQ